MDGAQGVICNFSVTVSCDCSHFLLRLPLLFAALRLKALVKLVEDLSAATKADRVGMWILHDPALNLCLDVELVGMSGITMDC